MPFGGAGPDADARSRISHRTTAGNERGQDVDLAGGRRPGERTSEVAVSHDAGLTRLRVMSPRITAVTAMIAPI